MELFVELAAFGAGLALGTGAARIILAAVLALTFGRSRS